MPSHPSVRRIRTAAATLILIVACSAAIAGPAGANSRSFRAYARHGGVFVFKVSHVRPASVKYGTVKVLGEHWRVSRRRLDGAVRHGRLRAHTPRKVHAALAHRVSAAARRASGARLLIHLRGSKHPVRQPSGSTTTSTTTTTTTTTQAPAPTTQPAPSPSAPSGSGGQLTGPLADNTAPCDAGLGSFGAGRWPSACWRPYNSSSPFNRPLPANPRVVSNSDQIVSRLMGFGKIQNLLAGLPGTSNDYGHPTYWSSAGDPWFTVHCTENWGTCPIEGTRIQIPDRAQAAGGTDAHLTVVDQSSGWEYDMWGVQHKPAGGGTITTSWAGKTRIDGDGLGSNAVAAGYGTMAGKLRAEELAAGHIDHALFMVVNCDSGQHVYPAIQSGRSCSQVGASNTNAPSMGQRFQLDMSDAQIDALAVPDWKKTILRAMAHYGMYVGDTGGSWAIKEESGASYTSLGYPDKWVQLAKQDGVPYYAPDNDWIFNLSDGVDWQRYLRVIDPCEANGSCS